MVTETEAPDSTVGALRDLTQSVGWKLFKDALEAEWGDVGLGRAMQRAMAKIPLGPERSYQLAEVAERVQATYDAAHEMLGWPEREIKRLSGDKKPKTMLDAIRRIPR